MRDHVLYQDRVQEIEAASLSKVSLTQELQLRLPSFLLYLCLRGRQRVFGALASNT